MDHRLASAQILRAVRGKRSQRAFSRRLGYRANVASDWESGRRTPTAAEALRACHRVGIDVGAAFARFQPACAPALGKAPHFQIARWLGELAGSLGVSELAARSGISRYAIARWLQGKTRPRLHDFLRLVEAISGRASDLVQDLVPIAQVAELQQVAARRAAARRLAFDEPWSAAVMRVLETRAYRDLPQHSRAAVAARLDLDVDEADRVLARLEAAGLLRREHGRFVVGEPLTVDTHASDADVQKLKYHWAEVGARRAAAPARAKDWLGFNLVSISELDRERIVAVMRRAFREIRAIAAASEPAESVALLNFQLITWDEQSPAETRTG
jgi:transcriptional regulator with XRE-family HTH domain